MKQGELDKKKQLREERAKLVRDRARRKKEGGEELDYEIEQDDAFNVEGATSPSLPVRVKLACGSHVHELCRFVVFRQFLVRRRQLSRHNI